MGKKRIKKKFTAKKGEKNNNNKGGMKNKYKFHLDDKGRRIFELDKIQLEKKEQIQKRKENLKKNLEIKDSIFQCIPCGLSFTNNIALKEHLNSREHNKIIGKDTLIKEVSVETIKEKLMRIKKQRDLEKQEKKLIKKTEKINEDFKL